MPKTKKYVQLKHLKNARSWIVDTDPSSQYFRVSEISDVLTSGKNSFLINGTPELVNTTELLIELVDSDGNSVFLTPIENYNEGASRVVSIEIYEDTPKGAATLTIMGEIFRDQSGNVVPKEWQRKYNVKWQKTVFIDPFLSNTSKIRLYNYPKIETSELLSIYYTPSQSMMYLSQSATMSGVTYIHSDATTAIIGSAGSYYVQSSLPTFDKNMEGGIFSAFITGSTPFITTIEKVINTTIAKLTDNYVINGVSSLFSTENFTLSYSSSISYTPTELTRSFVSAKLTNLQTFSGQIKKVKLSVHSKESPSEFSIVGDSLLTPTELLEVTASIQQGNKPLQIGNISNQYVVSAFWTYGVIGASNYSN